MKRWKTLRGWHTWASLALGIPLLVVGVTAVLFALEKPLGLDAVRVDAGWLPGYAGRDGADETPLKAALTLPDGRLLLGTRQGLLERVEGLCRPVEGFPAADVRQLVAAGSGALACTPQGLWRLAEGRWSRLHAADAHGAAVAADGAFFLATKHEGLLASRDGGATWSRESLPALPADGRPTLAKLVDDLHTGKAFLGKSGQVWWIVLSGVALTFLVITGLSIWIKIQWHKWRRPKAVPR